jgi:hypothetical protein
MIKIYNMNNKVKLYGAVLIATAAAYYFMFKPTKSVLQTDGKVKTGGAKPTDVGATYVPPKK